jgi:hypothetical protein
MSKKPDNRVLSRQLARDLTPQELETITGGFFTSPHRDVPPRSARSPQMVTTTKHWQGPLSIGGGPSINCPAHL